MAFTNRSNLPIPVLQLTEFFDGSYSKGESDISTTSLIGEPLQRVLKRVHAAEIIEDVVDYTHRLIGNALHKALKQMAGEDGCQIEQRLYSKINGWTVSGEPDYYVGLEQKKVTDYKYTAKYKTRDGVPEEWKKQISIYAYLLREQGHTVDSTEFCVWYRDAYLARGDVPVEMVACEPYTNDQVLEYLNNRVAYHQVSDPEFNPLIDMSCVPECSDKARFYKPPTYAFMKTGRKGAIKLHATREDAEKDVSINGTKGYYIQERKATNDMCTSYCSVAKFCQYETRRRNDGEQSES